MPFDTAPSEPLPPAKPKGKTRDISSIRVSVIVCYPGITPHDEPRIAVLRKNTRPWGDKEAEPQDIWGLANAKADRTDKKKARVGKKKRYTISQQRRIARMAALRELPEETGLHVQDKAVRLRYLGKVPLPRALSKRGNRFVFAAFVAGTPDTHPIVLSEEHNAWWLVPRSSLGNFLNDETNVPDTLRRDHYSKVAGLFLRRAPKRVSKAAQKAFKGKGKAKALAIG